MVSSTSRGISLLAIAKNVCGLGADMRSKAKSGLFWLVLAANDDRGRLGEDRTWEKTQGMRLRPSGPGYVVKQSVGHVRPRIRPRTMAVIPLPPRGMRSKKLASGLPMAALIGKKRGR